MLDSLRGAKSNFLLQVVIALIVLSFVFWIGVGGLGTGEVTVIAMVNGERITDTDYNQALRSQMENYRRLTGQSIPQEMEATVRNQVRDDLITRTLIRQEAQKMGLVVGDKELALRIAEIPGLRDENGKFQKELYDGFIARRPNFESDLRDDILIEKAQRLVSDSAQVSSVELKGRFLAESDEINLEFVRVSKLSFERDAAVADADVTAAVEARKDEISAIYERDKARKYDIPKKARARHILKKLDPTADDAAKAEAKTAIEGILAEAKAEPTAEKFSALAQEHSDDKSNASRGGDLGFFDEKRMDPAFSAATFALQPGQISEVVESRFGYHIIYLEAFQDPKLIPLEEAQAEIARDLLKREAGEALAKTYADRLFEAWKAGGDIEPILAEHSLTAQETGLFAKEAGRVPRLGASGDVLDTVFGLSEETPFTSGPIDVPGGFAIVKLKERKGPDMARFEEEKATLKQRYENEKRRAIVQAWIDQLKADADLQVSTLS